MERSSPTNSGRTARWAAVSVFALASMWNYLDRQILSAASPSVKAEFHLSNTAYGWLGSAFGFAYALSSPALGWFLDAVGVETGIAWAVGFWSLAAMVCGWTRTFGQLIVSRIFLAVGESAGIPAAGKVNTMYLEPENRAFGAAISQVGLTAGSVAAPLLVGAFTGWRTPFFVCGALGLAWIPLWLAVRSRVAPFEKIEPRRNNRTLELLRDPRLGLLIFANIFWMVGYALWSFWTTVYLAESFHLTTNEANRYAWIPPIGATLGGFAGGWLSRHFMARGASAVRARVLAIGISAFGCLICIAGPSCRTPMLATLVASASYFWTLAGSVNVYTIPLDIWGGERAGQAISFLVLAYGLLQTAISPAIGAVVDRFGFGPVCWMIAVPPFAGWMLLRVIERRSRA